MMPAWFDEARYIIQRPAFERVLGSASLRGRVLNAGAGEGLYASFLEQFEGVRQIVNLDLSRPSVARRRPDARHRDVQGSLTALPFANECFDAVMVSEVLEHIEADGVATSELARVLAPGGLLLASVPTPPAPPDSNHVREGYHRDELAAILGEHGIDVVGHQVCFHWISRVLYECWTLQSRLLKRNWFPRLLLRWAALADRNLPVGKPWDLVVLAYRRPAMDGARTRALLPVQDAVARGSFPVRRG